MPEALAPDVESWETLMAMLVEQADADDKDGAGSKTMAPYKIFKVGAAFVVKNNAGEVKATFPTYAKALAYLRALYANVPGAPGQADKKDFTGKQKRAATVKTDS